MKKFLLDLCLLAYSHARRERDRDYLRDLALDLSECGGLLRQALSLLRGGLIERIEVRRRRRDATRSAWMRRAAVPVLAFVALAFAATSLIAPAERNGEWAEVEVFACVPTDHPPSQQGQVPLNRSRECAGTKALIAARVRQGWDCETHRRTGNREPEVAWRCTIERELVVWRAS